MRPTAAYHKTGFARIASRTSHLMGHPVVFTLACGLIVAWLGAGPIFGFSDTWQLVINTATTTIPFLMVFLIQNTQNRESMAVHVKLDELIRAVKGAHNALIDLEDLTEDELNKIRERYVELARKARQDLSRGIGDTSSQEVGGDDPGAGGGRAEKKRK